MHPHPTPRCSTFLSHPHCCGVHEIHLSLPPPLHREEEVGGRALRGVLGPAGYLVTLKYNHLALHISFSALDRVGSAGSVVARGVYWVPSW